MSSTFTRELQEPPPIRYEVVLYWSEIDQAYIAEVPELPGCAADGATYHEALEAIQLVIQEWIETARELQRTIPEPKIRPLRMRRVS